MIQGQVTPDKEAVVALRVIGANAVETTARAVLDTGFTAFLSLPPDIVAALALPYDSTVTMVLAGAA